MNKEENSILYKQYFDTVFNSILYKQYFDTVFNGKFFLRQHVQEHGMLNRFYIHQTFNCTGL